MKEKKGWGIADMRLKFNTSANRRVFLQSKLKIY